MVVNLQVPQKVGNFLPSSVIISFSRRTLLHAGSCVEDALKVLMLFLFCFVLSTMCCTLIAEMSAVNHYCGVTLLRKQTNH